MQLHRFEDRDIDDKKPETPTVEIDISRAPTIQPVAPRTEADDLVDYIQINVFVNGIPPIPTPPPEIAEA